MELTPDAYFSVADESQGVYREKASKFIAVACPVSSEEEVKLKLETFRKLYYDANHHCYAYRIGHEIQVHRSNDDGEPAGSAGKPIYGQIQSAGLSDVLIVVIRYFGGTKLGVPGLIHAYKTAAREALDNAKVVEKVIRVRCRVVFEYESMNNIMRILKDDQIKILSHLAEERYAIEFLVRKSQHPKVVQRLEELRNVAVNSGENESQLI